MREIKFRGKSVETGKWVYGDIIEIAGESFIIGEGVWTTSIDQYNIDYTKVTPETVGQYTGRKDKNGKEIYEGDIVKCAVNGIITYSVVKMKNGRWIGENKGKAQDDNIFSIKDIEVIGNIYKNSELLEEDG